MNVFCPFPVYLVYCTSFPRTAKPLLFPSVEGQPIVRLQSSINSYSDFNSPASTTQVAYGDLNGLVTGISSTEFGIAIGDMTLSGNHFLGTENQFSFKTDTAKIEAGGTGYQSADLFLDSSAKQLSLGSVFSADGDENTGKLAGAYFNANKMTFTNNVGSVLGWGIYHNWPDDVFSIGEKLRFSSSRKGVPSENV